MAGYIVRRRLEKPVPHSKLQEGLNFWRWEEVCGKAVRASSASVVLCCVRTRVVKSIFAVVCTGRQQPTKSGRQVR